MSVPPALGLAIDVESRLLWGISARQELVLRPLDDDDAPFAVVDSGGTGITSNTSADLARDPRRPGRIYARFPIIAFEPGENVGRVLSENFLAHVDPFRDALWVLHRTGDVRRAFTRVDLATGDEHELPIPCEPVAFDKQTPDRAVVECVRDEIKLVVNTETGDVVDGPFFRVRDGPTEITSTGIVSMGAALDRPIQALHYVPFGGEHNVFIDVTLFREFPQSFAVHENVVAVVGGSPLLLSSDGGATFERISPPCLAGSCLFPRAVAFDEVGDLYAGGDLGIFVRRDEVWARVSRVTLGPSDELFAGDGAIYVGNGRWRRVVGDVTQALRVDIPVVRRVVSDGRGGAFASGSSGEDLVHTEGTTATHPALAALDARTVHGIGVALDGALLLATRTQLCRASECTARTNNASAALFDLNGVDMLVVDNELLSVRGSDVTLLAPCVGGNIAEIDDERVLVICTASSQLLIDRASATVSAVLPAPPAPLRTAAAVSGGIVGGTDVSGLLFSVDGASWQRIAGTPPALPHVVSDGARVFATGPAGFVTLDVDDIPTRLLPPGCGDEVAVGPETCDDANETRDDGCSACAVDEGFLCDLAVVPSLCERSTCGNGVREFLEECDDGNVRADDGCSPTCSTRNGQSQRYECEGETPDVCLPTCGDGVLDEYEQCDDGGNADGDGCSSACFVDGFCLSRTECAADVCGIESLEDRCTPNPPPCGQADFGFCALFLPGNGCSDGQAEGFVQLEDISGCVGNFAVPGLATPPTCGRRAGNTGVFRSGAGCSANDLCAEGFHVCRDVDDVAESGGRCDQFNGCSGFFATQQASDNGYSCPDHPATVLDDTVIDGRGFFGCDAGGGNRLQPCGNTLTTFSGPHCSALSEDWHCGGPGEDDVASVTKTGGFGGVLCCRD